MAHYNKAKSEFDVILDGIAYSELEIYKFKNKTQSNVNWAIVWHKPTRSILKISYSKATGIEIVFRIKPNNVLRKAQEGLVGRYSTLTIYDIREICERSEHKLLSILDAIEYRKTGRHTLGTWPIPEEYRYKSFEDYLSPFKELSINDFIKVETKHRTTGETSNSVYFLNNLYQYLFHATFRANLQSIKKKGIEPGHTKNWEDSNKGVICLSTDPEVAYSYCESAEEVSEYKYDSGIVVLAIPTVVLNPLELRVDRNVRSKGQDSYEYHSNIPAKYIHVCTSSSGIVGELSKLKRVPAYE